MEKIITIFRKQMKVACDGKCHKAWRLNNRPKINLSDDDDDVCWLSDNELDIAPKDPGTYEGGHGKPYNSTEFPNKWCVRECERCERFELDEEVILVDWNKRFYNQPFKHINEE